MTAQNLKNSILQLAIQGKLVEQRPEEGTAKELLEQIKIEKEQLIKVGKLKKEKPLPEITEDEIPFEIPDSWEWVRFGKIIQTINGDRGKNYPSKDKLSDSGIPFVSAVNLSNNTVSTEKLLYMSQEQYDKLGGGKLIKGDLVLCIRGSLGKNGKYPFETGAIASSLVILRSYISAEIFYEYISQYLDSGLFSSEVNIYNNGTAQPNLGARDLEKFIFPIPPLEEQKRILAKIEDLLPYVEQYDKAYSKLEMFNKRFPEYMQKSILQYAIQGKLVEQRPEEGTAEELYQKIQAEKAKLIKEGKIKKEMPLGEITDDEIPFEIPESWIWVRLGSLAELITKGSSPSWQGISYTNEGLLFVTSENVGVEQLLLDSPKYLEERFNEIQERSILKKGDILTNIVGASIGRAAIYDRDETANINQAVCLIRLINDNVNDYITKYLNSYVAYKIMMNDKVDTARANISLANISNFIVPLPPLSEQKRIVKALEEYLPYCQQLIK